MKKLGIIGGMSWQSTQTYYSLLNNGIKDRLGGLHSAELLLYSFDFARIAQLQADGAWDQATQEMIAAGTSLKAAGADMLLIATNTMHKMADAVQTATSLPLLHIADATADAIKRTTCQRPLLLATNFTMTQDFYKGRLATRHNIHVTVPNDQDKDEIHRIIYEELCQGAILAPSKQHYLSVIAHYQKHEGIDGVIFGCTEIGLLLSQDDLTLPCFDTTFIHCDFALDHLLAD